MLRSPYWLALLPAMFWGSNVVVAGAVIPGVQPAALAFCRWTAAMLFLLPFALPHLWRQRAIVFRHWRILTVLGVLGISGFNLLVYLALETTSAVNTALVQGCLPVAVIVASWVINRDSIGWRAAGGMALAFAGVVIVITDADLGVLRALEFRTGDLINVSAMWIWGVYVVLLNRRPLELHPLAFLLVIIMIGDCLTGAIYLSGLLGPVAIDFTLPRVGAIAYIALFPSLLAFHLWSRAITALGPNVAGQFQYLIPVFGMLFAVLLLGEPLRLYHVLAIVIVLTGVWLASKPAIPAPGDVRRVSDSGPAEREAKGKGG